MSELGIIGLGAFGQFAAKHLSPHFKVYAYDSVNREKEAIRVGAELIDFDTVVSKEIVILAMPMNALEETIEKMKGKTKSGALVMDICSLKTYPEKIMKKNLKDVEIIGTHPLFGPQSAAESIEGCKIAICNFKAKEETMQKVKKFCESIGLKVYITTAEEHDKQMASSQAITHFIGMSLYKSGIEKVEMSTKSFDKLMDVVDIVKNDSKELFEGMHVYNKESKSVRKRYIEETKKLDKYLGKLKSK